MLFRVVLVTLFLGSALAVDTEALSNLADFKNSMIVGLIVFTYVATIVYALLINKISLDRMARIQMGVDLGITFVLTLITSGLDSVFLFLFYIHVINAAVVAGRRFSLYVAGATTVALVGLAAVDFGWVTLPKIYPIYRPTNVTILRMGLNIAAAIVTGFLAGHLAQRLGQATEEIVRQRGDIAQLRALNLNILSSLTSGLITLDEDGKIIFFNRAATEITHLTESNALGESLEQLLPALWCSLIDTEGRSRREVELERPDKTSVYLGFTVSPLLGPQDEQTGHIIIFQDLSDIRRLETQMRRSERLAAVGQLSAAIAHEIRNPLASISGSVEMLRDVSQDDDDQMLMGIVIREVDRLNALITDFLNYARPHQLQLAEVRVKPLMEEIARLVATQADVSLEPDIDDGLAAFADEQGVRQILWNLVNNAAEASPQTKRPRVLLGGHTINDETILSVEDDGPSVPLELRERIFEPFYTTKEKGTGLGLATIFRMMEEHGASITITEPKTLQGARFELRFQSRPGR